MITWLYKHGLILIFGMSDTLYSDSFWASDAIWWHRSILTLVQVMASYLTAQNHNLNQWWLIRGFYDFHLRAISSAHGLIKCVLETALWKSLPHVSEPVNWMLTRFTNNMICRHDKWSWISDIDLNPFASGRWWPPFSSKDFNAHIFLSPAQKVVSCPIRDKKPTRGIPNITLNLWLDTTIYIQAHGYIGTFVKI